MLIPNIGNSQPAAIAVRSDTPRVATDTVSTTDTTPQTSKPVTSGQLNDAVGVINRAMQKSHQSLEFSVDSSTKIPVVKMTDSETGQVISQFPSEAALAIAHAIDQIHPGLLLKQQA